MIIPSIRQRRLRFNHERMLEFNPSSSQYISASQSINFGTGNWAFSVVFEAQSLGANRSIFSLFAASTLIELAPLNNGQLVFRLDPTNQPFTGFTIPVNRIYQNLLNHIIIQRSGTTIEWYLNGEYESNLFVLTASSQFNFTSSTLHIGAIQSPTAATDYFHGFINNFIIFNTSLNSAQAATLFAKAGAVERSLHANIIGHWPLTQVSYAGFNAWDTVEQYNYAKSAALTPNHGTLNGYTNSSLGGIDSATQTVIHNIHSKSVQSDLGLSEERAAQSSDYSTNLPSSSSFTFGAKAAFFDVDASGVSNYIMVACGARNRMTLRTASNQIRQLIIDNVVLGPGAIQTSVVQDMGIDFNNKHNIFLISFNATNRDVIFATKSSDLIKIITVPVTGYNWAWVSTGGRNINVRGEPFTSSSAVFDMKSVMSEAAVWTTNLSEAQLRDVLEQEDFSLFSPDTEYFVSSDQDFPSFLNISERNGNFAFDLTNVAGANYSGIFLEKRSGLPRIKKGLTLNGTSEYFEIPNFNPTGENGYTFSFAFALDSNRVFRTNTQDTFFSMRGQGTDNLIIRGVGNSKALNIIGFFSGNGLSYNLNLGITGSINLSDINQIDIVIENKSPGHVITTYLNGSQIQVNSGVAVVDLSIITGSAFIARDDGQSKFLQGRLFSFRISKSVSNAASIARTYNNSLLEYYFPVSSEDQVIMSFNAPYFSENGINVRVRNFASVFPTINVLGFSGATTQDQLLTVGASIITLDSVR